MTRSWVTDARRLADQPAHFVHFVRRLVDEARALPPGVRRRMSVTCASRTGSNDCPANLVAERLEKPEEIHWHCRACDQHGVVRHWRELEAPTVVLTGEEQRELCASLLDPGEGTPGGTRPVTELVRSVGELEALLRLVERELTPPRLQAREAALRSVARKLERAMRRERD